MLEEEETPISARLAERSGCRSARGYRRAETNDARRLSAARRPRWRHSRSLPSGRGVAAATSRLRHQLAEKASAPISSASNGRKLRRSRTPRAYAIYLKWKRLLVTPAGENATCPHGVPFVGRSQASPAWRHRSPMFPRWSVLDYRSVRNAIQNFYNFSIVFAAQARRGNPRPQTRGHDQTAAHD